MIKGLEEEYLEDLDHYDEGMGIHSTSYEKCKERLIRLAKIESANPSEALEWLNQQIQRLNDDLQHYTMVEKDKAIEYQISEDLKELNTIKQALIKAQEQEKELADVEMVKSGKTIIHIGKDLVMMNKAKYKEYLELENEPVSKRILQAKCEEQEKVLEVISKKIVGIFQLKCCKNVDEYNDLKFYDSEKLTEEEFELLKEYLECL